MKKRLFVGIPLTPNFSQKLDQFRVQTERLNSLREGEIRWIPRVNLHLTVCFLGSVEERFIEAVSGIIRTEVAGIATFALTFDRICLAPVGKSPRMIWVVFQNSPHFNRLGKKLTRKLEKYFRQIPEFKLKFATNRPLVPHITLARFRPAKPSAGWLLPQWRDKQIKLKIKECALYSSKTSTSGAVYTIIAKLALATIAYAITPVVGTYRRCQVASGGKQPRRIVSGSARGG